MEKTIQLMQNEYKETLESEDLSVGKRKIMMKNNYSHLLEKLSNASYQAGHQELMSLYVPLAHLLSALQTHSQNVTQNSEETWPSDLKDSLTSILNQVYKRKNPLNGLISLQIFMKIIIYFGDVWCTTLLPSNWDVVIKYLINSWLLCVSEISWSAFTTDQRNYLISLDVNLREWIFLRLHAIEKCTKVKLAVRFQKAVTTDPWTFDEFYLGTHTPIHTLVTKYLTEQKLSETQIQSTMKELDMKISEKTSKNSLKRKQIVISSDSEDEPPKRKKTQKKVESDEEMTTSSSDAESTHSHTGTSSTTVNGKAIRANAIKSLFGKGFVQSTSAKKNISPLMLYPCSSIVTKVDGNVTSYKQDQPKKRGQVPTTTQQKKGEFMIETKLYITDSILGKKAMHSF